MIDVGELLQLYLTEIARVGGATAASLFLPVSVAGAQSPGLLVHTADAPAVPELADLETARRYSFEDRAPADAGPAFKTGGAAVRASAKAGGVLLPIPRLVTLLRRTGKTPVGQGRRRSDGDDSLLGAGWIGLRFDAGGLQPNPWTLSQAAEPGSDSQLVHLLDLARALSSCLVGVYGILMDRVTGLPGRAVLEALLVDEFERARHTGHPFALLFVNPQDFGDINRRFGPKTGDVLLREIASEIQAAVRATDPVMRHGAAIFAVALAATRPDGALVVAEKIRKRLSRHRFFDGNIQLSFNVGTAAYEPGHDDLKEGPWDLVQRADVALSAARQAGGAHAVLWGPELEALDLRRTDRLAGIYTGRMEKDYRNMGLLWHALSAVSAEGSPRQLASRVVHKLSETFTADRVALAEMAVDGSLRVVSGVTRSDDQGAIENDELNDKEAAIISQAVTEKRAVRGDAAAAAHELTPRTVVAYAVPLVAGGDPFGAIYVAGRAEELGLDVSDLGFLNAFAAQVAVALDRAQLAEREATRVDQERAQLRAEVDELRVAVRKSKILYRSSSMERVLATARRAASTDATVLITGESGTGKERLAHAVHELSRRRDKPLVIVDCGAITPTLMESELFGHERGAFTGAERRATGRLLQADGGTLALDEIGELPLQVQAKLLRFVQEKQFTPVGGVRPTLVDVRIIAMTNRDLEKEVAAGRFREDLFYRLNVVRLQIPPLRERPEDILLLAHHFLRMFAVQYERAVRSISPQTEARLVAGVWPGNVRQLENRILQAVIVSQGEILDDAALGLSETQAVEPARPHGSSRGNLSIVETRGRSSDHLPSALPPTNGRAATGSGTSGDGASIGDPWMRLRVALRQEIDESMRANGVAHHPVGRWLSHEASLVAYDVAGRVAARAAALAGTPETTFARRLEKAAADAAVSVRSTSWPAVRDALLDVFQSPLTHEGTSMADCLNELLFDEVVTRLPDDARAGAQLLGISLPTFRRRAAGLAHAS